MGLSPALRQGRGWVIPQARHSKPQMGWDEPMACLHRHGRYPGQARTGVIALACIVLNAGLRDCHRRMPIGIDSPGAQAATRSTLRALRSAQHSLCNLCVSKAVAGAPPAFAAGRLIGNAVLGCGTAFKAQRSLSGAQSPQRKDSGGLRSRWRRRDSRALCIKAGAAERPRQQAQPKASPFRPHESPDPDTAWLMPARHGITTRSMRLSIRATLHPAGAVFPPVPGDVERCGRNGDVITITGPFCADNIKWLITR